MCEQPFGAITQITAVADRIADRADLPMQEQLAAVLTAPSRSAGRSCSQPATSTHDTIRRRER